MASSSGSPYGMGLPFAYVKPSSSVASGSMNSNGQGSQGRKSVAWGHLPRTANVSALETRNTREDTESMETDQPSGSQKEQENRTSGKIRLYAKGKAANFFAVGMILKCQACSPPFFLPLGP